MAKRAVNRITTFDYLRKSTKGERRDSSGRVRERQEKSLPQQRKELDKLPFPEDLRQAGYDGYEVVETPFADEGISGWKLGNKRPGFQRMIEAIKQHPARDKTIRVDNMDRFSRADVDDTQEVARELKRAGVKWIVSAADGVFHIGRTGNDLVELMRFVFAAHKNHEFSRQLSRRIALARRNAAEVAKRTGGKAPFGYSNDGSGGLKHGDKKEIKVVRQIFAMFVDDLLSLNRIADTLNQQKIKAARGGKWTRCSVREILVRQSYAGDFTYNRQQRGRFFKLDEKGEVVETEPKTEPRANGKVYRTECVYRPIIDRTMFDKAQKRLTTISTDRSRRKRLEGRSLTGVLVCDHCGSTLYSVQQNSPIVYRCGRSNTYGASTGCPNWQVRERDMLPFILKLLGEEIRDLQSLLSFPPEKLARPRRQQAERRNEAEQERAKLAQQIAKTEERVWQMVESGIGDARDQKMLLDKLAERRKELEQLDAELAADIPTTAYTSEELQSLNAWWNEFMETAVSVPVKGNVPAWTAFFEDPFEEDRHLLADPRKVNEALLTIGCEVRLRWKTREWTARSGRAMRQYDVVGGRFRLGQQKKYRHVPQAVLANTVRRPST